MIYRDVDISQIALFDCSEEVAKAVVDWRLDGIKKGCSDLVFNRALKTAIKCVQTGEFDCVNDVLIRWMESGWTGIKYVLQEAQRAQIQTQQMSIQVRQVQAQLDSTRNMSPHDELGDRSWALEKSEFSSH